MNLLLKFDGMRKTEGTGAMCASLRLLARAKRRKMLVEVAIFVLCACTCINSHAQLESNAKQQGELRGSVRTVRIEKAYLVMEDGQFRQSSRAVSELIAYDSRGRKTADTLYDRQGRWTAYDYSYDPRGNATRVVQYNDQGRVMSSSTIISDREGHALQEASYGPDGSAETKTIHSYDAKGNETQQLTYDCHGFVTQRLAFKYGKEARLAEVDFHAGNLPDQLGLTRGSDGLVSGDVVPDYLNGRAVFSYGTDGHLSRIVTYRPDDVLLTKRVLTWDAGREVLTEDFSYGPDGSVVSRKRTTVDEVDSYGNATRLSEFEWNNERSSFRPIDVTYKTYSYYWTLR